MSVPPNGGSGRSLEQVIGRIDRRLVYLGLFLITLAPLVGKWSLRLYPTPPAQALVDTINGLPTDRLVFISSNWDAGTQAENRPQLVAVTRHLIRRGVKFAVISIGSANAPQLADTAIKEAIVREGAQDRWQYGRDWVNLGYKIANDPWLRSFSREIPSAVKEDWKGTPLAQIPVMQGVTRFGPDGQVSAMLDFTGSATVDSWYQYLSPTKAIIGLGCTAVMAPEQYPYLDSGQLSGLLTGMKGAAEYEQLTGAKGQGMPAMAGQSFAHLYIFLLILLGNLSVLLGWLERRRAAR
jgi:hypothetical protein